MPLSGLICLALSILLSADIVLEGLITSRYSYPETQYFESNKLPAKLYFYLNPYCLVTIGYNEENFSGSTELVFSYRFTNKN